MSAAKTPVLGVGRLGMLIACWLLCLGCERSPLSSPDPGYGYFPLIPGQYAEYEITETTYALNQPPLTRTYRLRETTGEKYTDATGQDVYPITRASKSPQGEWVPDSVYLAWRTADKALRAENGRTYVKIQFPARENARWNGNLFNPMAEQFYEITALNKSMQEGAGTYDKTLTVVQQNDSTLLSLRRSQEIYAEGIGLIRRERTFLQYCGTPGCRGTIDYGYRQLSTLIKYAK